jgi:antirestriction protein ArdC
MASNQSARADIYEKTTAHIINAIEQGAGDWRMPWHHNGRTTSRPINVVTRKRYRGGNVMMLWTTADMCEFGSGVWGTYRQWAELGGHVRKGQTGTPVIFWKRMEGRGHQSQDDKQDSNLILFARGFTVFNQDQVDGYTPPAIPELDESQRIPEAQAFFDNCAIKTIYGGDVACYIPSQDVINMPNFSQFKDAASFFSTLAHETAHAVGHKSRLDRKFGTHFGDELYSREELVAEISASFIMADLGFASTPRPDHAAYIQSFLKTLKNDPKALITAASKAQAAADWMHAAQPQQQQQAA